MVRTIFITCVLSNSRDRVVIVNLFSWYCLHIFWTLRCYCLCHKNMTSYPRSFRCCWKFTWHLCRSVCMPLQSWKWRLLRVFFGWCFLVLGDPVFVWCIELCWYSLSVSEQSQVCITGLGWLRAEWVCICQAGKPWWLRGNSNNIISL